MTAKPKPTGMAFLDIETSGLNPFHHEPIEVGIVHREVRGEEQRAVEWSIQFTLPFNLELASSDALRINGFYTRTQEGSWPSPVSYKWGADYLQRSLKDVVIVGNNISFDLMFLQYFIWNTLHEPPTWYYAPVELKALFAGAHSMRPPVSLSAVARDLGVEITDKDKHTALGDARWNRDLYDAWIRSLG